MSKLSRLMCLGLGLGILTVAIGTLSTPPAAAAPGPTNVIVTNTPLPVQAPNSNTTPLPANVTNFPSTQNVSGTVNVGNFPAAQSVTITNPQTQPIPISDAQNQPFGILLNPVLTDGSGRGTAGFTVPSGQRLIIEFIGGNVCLPVGQKAIFDVDVVVGTAEVGYVLPAIAEGTFNLFGGGPCDNFAVTQQVRIYAEPNSTVTVGVVRSDSTGSTFAGVGVSGHLVNTQ
jgi:hypothetical protein